MENFKCAKLVKIILFWLIFANILFLSQQFDVFVSVQCLVIKINEKIYFLYYKFNFYGNDLYVATRRTNKGFAGLVAESASVTVKNFFSLTANSDETISFNVKFGDDWLPMVMDEKLGGKLRTTSDLDKGANAKFKLIRQTSGKFVIKASNGKFVSCKSENHWLIADKDSAQSLYEEFELDMVTKITDTVTARVPLKIL